MIIKENSTLVLRLNKLILLCIVLLQMVFYGCKNNPTGIEEKLAEIIAEHEIKKIDEVLEASGDNTSTTKKANMKKLLSEMYSEIYGSDEYKQELKKMLSERFSPDQMDKMVTMMESEPYMLLFNMGWDPRTRVERERLILDLVINEIKSLQ